MSLSSWKVLVIEDDVDNQHVIEDALHLYSPDINVVCTAAGREGLEIADTFHPTVVIVDLSLPDIDGWQVLAALRSQPHTAEIPIIAMTAYHSPSVLEDAIQAGFDAYFTKPIDVTAIGQQIASFIQ